MIGAGLGSSSLSQVMVIQESVPERQRGVATSLVPFSRTVGGAVGVGALGGLLTGGLATRLGASMEAASKLLAGRGRRGRYRSEPEVFRLAIERSLVPVFAVLLGLAVLNFFIVSGFPETARSTAEPPKGTEALV